MYAIQGWMHPQDGCTLKDGCSQDENTPSMKPSPQKTDDQRAYGTHPTGMYQSNKQFHIIPCLLLNYCWIRISCTRSTTPFTSTCSHITSNDQPFACSIIYIDMKSQCYFVPQECLAKQLSFTSFVIIAGDVRRV